jgi:hypothetical protein
MSSNALLDESLSAALDPSGKESPELTGPLTSRLRLHHAPRSEGSRTGNKRRIAYTPDAAIPSKQSGSARIHSCHQFRSGGTNVKHAAAAQSV